jgi:hypothetical protein
MMDQNDPLFSSHAKNADTDSKIRLLKRPNKGG